MGERGDERGLEDEVEIFETEKFEIYLDCVCNLLRGTKLCHIAPCLGQRIQLEKGFKVMTHMQLRKDLRYEDKIYYS